MRPELKEALFDYLLALADDEFTIGHRDSEWAGHAPILEEDIAFANIALDELGHAKLWYTLLADLNGEDGEAYVDQLIYFREAPTYRSVQLVEFPKGDWAFSIMRQYLFDSAEVIRLQKLTTSKYRPLADVAVKVNREEVYHVRHTHAWIKRLGLGTEESHRRTQSALDQLWAYAHQLFQPVVDEALLNEADFVPDSAVLRTHWRDFIIPQLQKANLNIPENDRPPACQRTIHTNFLVDILTDLQSVARKYPDANW